MVEVVVAVPGFDPGTDVAAGGLAESARLGVEKEDFVAVQKCLAVALAYLGGRKMGKNAVRDLGRQMERGEKGEGKEVAVLRTGELTLGSDAGHLKSLRIVLSKRIPAAVVTREVFEILDMLSEIQVDGEIQVVLECRGQEEGEKARIKR